MLSHADLADGDGGMMRLFSIASLVMTAAFALLLALARAQPRTDLALAALGGCDVFCWHGIQPGVTSPLDAVDQLSAYYGFAPGQARCFSPPSPVCLRFTWYPENGQPSADLVVDHGAVEALIVQPAGFTLGDALLSLSGLPGDLLGATHPSVANGHFYFQLVFSQARLLLELGPVCAGGVSSLMHAPVRSLSVSLSRSGFDSQSLEPGFISIRERWHQSCER